MTIAESKKLLIERSQNDHEHTAQKLAPEENEENDENEEDFDMENDFNNEE